MKNMDKNVLGCNFFENEYFFINPKADEAHGPLFSKTSKNIENG